MKKPLEGKVALITGSSQGIGKAIATELGQLGASVVLNGRNPEKLQKANNELVDKGITTLPLAGDVTDFHVCSEMTDRIIHVFGHLDILVANASMSAEGNFIELPIEIFKSTVDSLFYGVALPIKAALPELVRSRGSIVVISSLAGLYGLQRYTAYSSGKMALTGFVQSLRGENSSNGLHIGIAYVGLTRNESEKRTYNINGELVPVPQRPPALQQSRETVARGIAAMIIRRRNRKVFSLMGKVQALIIRFTPMIFRLIARKL